MTEFPFESSLNRYITLSGWSDPRDCLSVQRKLYKYNQIAMGTGGERTTLSFSNEDIPHGTIVLDAHSGSLMLDVCSIAKKVKGDFPGFLEDLLASSASQGAERVHSIIPKHQLLLIETLKRHGFKIINEVNCISITEPSLLMMKILKPSGESTLDSKWRQQPPCILNLENCTHLFGAFLRGESGSPLGGIFGNLYNHGSGSKHAYVDVFFTDSSVRGLGFGWKLMAHIETFFKKHDVESIRLNTMDFQAPRLYEKLGFRRIWTMPDYLKTSDGKLSNLYEYVRLLKNR